MYPDEGYIPLVLVYLKYIIEKYRFLFGTKDLIVLSNKNTKNKDICILR